MVIFAGDMKLLIYVCALVTALAAAAGARAQEPQLRHVFDIHAECGDALDAGIVPGGRRVIIPITGGHTEGEISARIIPGGTDYQLVDANGSRVEFDAIYTLMTCDSLLIRVRNRGISTSGAKGDYFTTSPTFEAPAGSAYDWLNNRIFVCRPIAFGKGTVSLRVWMAE